MPGTRSLAVGDDAATGFLVAGTFMFAAVAAFCSSPQTAELNAKKRAKTLMKWVMIGTAAGAAMVFVGAQLASDPAPYYWGGGLVGLIMALSYVHAKRAGLKSNEAGTES